MKDATFLTEQYPGAEEILWTPCLKNFIVEYKPVLPLSECILPEQYKAPYYKKRERRAELDLSKPDKVILHEPQRDEFLYEIDKVFKMDLLKDENLTTSKGDISGIRPDILIIVHDEVLIIENKPYYASSLDGNQGIGGAYIDFVNYLNNEKSIKCTYIIALPIACDNKLYSSVLKIQEELAERFCIILWEDIFLEMHKRGFKYSGLNVDWKEYSDKGKDYFEST